VSTIALCIPAYNAAKFLPVLLESATFLKNTFNEIILYDDCSTDNTKEVAESLGATVIRGKENKGCAYGKNEMAKVAKSEWLHFHDADDLILPEFTAVAKKWINNTDSAEIILLHFQYIDFKTRILLGEPNYNRSELIKNPIKFVINNKVVNFAIIKKDAFLRIGGFDTNPKVLFNEDKAFYVRAAIAGLTFDYEPINTCVNYSYNESMSKSNAGKCAEAQYHVMKNTYDVLGKVYGMDIAHELYQNATYACFHNNWDIAKKSIKLATIICKEAMPQGSLLFIFLFKINRVLGFYLREHLLRIFKR
jgi:glycosyltransferase involved in cell wall biosynthesis